MLQSCWQISSKVILLPIRYVICIFINKQVDIYSLAKLQQEILYHKLPEKFQDALIRVNSFEINSIPQTLIEARFCGDDPAVLDSLTNIAIGIMRKNPKVLNARNEWGNMAMMIKAGYDPVKAGRLNIGRSDMMNAVKSVSTERP